MFIPQEALDRIEKTEVRKVSSPVLHIVIPIVIEESIKGAVSIRTKELIITQLDESQHNYDKDADALADLLYESVPADWVKRFMERWDKRCRRWNV